MVYCAFLKFVVLNIETFLVKSHCFLKFAIKVGGGGFYMSDTFGAMMNIQNMALVDVITYASNLVLSTN